jgi:hypothetical protein
MRYLVVTLAVISLVGAGCATTGTVQVKTGEELLAKSQKCIASLDQLPYEQINPGEPVKLAFDDQATVLQEGEKRCFAKGFALPAGKGAYSVSITSFKGGTVHDPAIMYPEVRILDQSYGLIRTLPHTDFVFRSFGSGEGVNAVFFVNNNSQGESFLLITNRPMEEASLIASQVNITSTTPIVVPVPGGMVMWFFPSGSNTPPIKMKASPMGQMEVEVKEYRPRKVGE